jgi:hypothetical protein
MRRMVPILARLIAPKTPTKIIEKNEEIGVG